MMVQLEKQENVVDDIERGRAGISGDSKMSSGDDSGGIKKPGVTMQKVRKGTVEKKIRVCF
jgi:hypothetical protein